MKAALKAVLALEPAAQGVASFPVRGAIRGPLRSPKSRENEIERALTEVLDNMELPLYTAGQLRRSPAFPFHASLIRDQKERGR